MRKELRLRFHDKRKRHLLRRFFIKRMIVKLLISCLNISLLHKIIGSIFKTRLDYNWGVRSASRYRCALTGRAHAVDRRVRLGRFALRLCFSSGRIPSFMRSS